jgi:hypothetical protein
LVFTGPADIPAIGKYALGTTGACMPPRVNTSSATLCNHYPTIEEHKNLLFVATTKPQHDSSPQAKQANGHSWFAKP